MNKKKHPAYNVGCFFGINKEVKITYLFFFDVSYGLKAFCAYVFSFSFFFF